MRENPRPGNGSGVLTTSTATTVVAPARDPRTAATSAFCGATLEYFDFGIYGVASALYFGQVFFPGVDPVLGTLLSLASYGAAYVTRPLGALIWGHLGDRIGRTRVLIMTLVLMGAATFLVGCLPDYRTIGVAAPVLLVVLRLLQGVSAGGESTGSSAVAMEHAPDHRRGLLSSVAMCGINSGTVLATAAFLLVATLPRDAAVAWGWRIPFLASALVFLVTYLIRRRLSESASFLEMKQEGAAARVPLLEVLRHDWPSMVRVALGSLLIVVYTLFAIYSLSFAGNVVHLDRSRMLLIVTVVLLLSICTQPLYGLLSDRIGRRPVFVLGSIGTAVFVFAFLAAIAAGNWFLIAVAGVALMSVFQAMMAGVAFAYFLELFPARTRFTGTGVSMMIGFLVGGFTPTIADSVVAGETGNWPTVAWIVAAVSVVAGLAVVTGPETHRVSTAALDRTRSGTA